MPRVATELDIRTVCTLVGAERRQRVLEYLQSADGVVRTGDVAESVATSIDVPPSEVETRLIHDDLPKFARANVIEYDPRRGTVEPTGRVETLCEVTSAIQETIESQVRV
ncbi:DUF7344 domain-containing protein [Halovivax limisalsi]|uniref:DUF7344 domain-containing protein n=1 Tax=Halovivax limisalsi TaxID=1453760 RepID=UPI001FFC5FC2|nr:hypothetical protein [Halovivax limisalsi]